MLLSIPRKWCMRDQQRVQLYVRLDWVGLFIAIVLKSKFLLWQRSMHWIRLVQKQRRLERRFVQHGRLLKTERLLENGRMCDAKCLRMLRGLFGRGLFSVE